MNFKEAKNQHYRITRLYILGFILIAVAIFGERYASDRIVTSTQHDAYVLSLSGKQRMLSQRILSLAQQLVSENEQFQSLEISSDADRIADLKKSIAEMRKAHAMLTKGDSFKGIEAPSDTRLKEIYFGDVSVDEKLQYFLSQADQVAHENVSRADRLYPVAIMVLLSEGLLHGLGEAVSTYADISTEKIAKLRNVQTGHVIFIAVLILLEIMFIFRPMARRIKEMMEALVREHDHLNDSLRREVEIASFAENAPVPIISMDQNGDFLYANPAAEEIVVGVKSGKVLVADLLQDSPSKFLQRQKTGHFKLTLDEKTYEGVAVPYMSGDFINVYLHDITLLKQTEEKANRSQRMEAIGQLTGGIAHDFNNLLMVITGSLQLAQSKLLGEKLNQAKVEKLITTALGAVGRTAKLTQSLLVFSRRQNLEPEKIEVADAIESFQPLLENALGGAVSLEIKHLEEAQPVIKIDRGQFESALLNLTINARDAMPNGGRLLIEVKQLTVNHGIAAQYDDFSPGKYVVVAVTDQGSGIPDDIRAKVFEPFYTTKEVGRGSGLGLSMVWGFMKQSNGHVTLYSEEGIGTTVRLFFPLQEASVPKLPQPQLDDFEAALAPGELILVAEDDGEMREWLSTELKTLGYEVLTSNNGQEALQLIKQRPEIAFVVSDIFMPEGMTGMELAREIHACREDLPVMLISGFPSGSVPEMHGERVLSKPFSRADLVRELTQTAAGMAA